MNIFLNGEARQVTDSAFLAEALTLAGIDDSRGIAVALDGNVIPSSDWSSTRLNDGAKLEVLRAVQGGCS
ncbi:MAG: sulfur carrier protein ThiS [Actinomycetota bacterium]